MISEKVALHPIQQGKETLRLMAGRAGSTWIPLEVIQNDSTGPSLCSIPVNNPRESVRTACQPSCFLTSTPRQVCDTTAELAAGMIETSGWQELLPFVFQLVQSPNPDSVESALLIFSQLAHYVMPVLTQYMGTLNGILQQTLQTQSPAVGLAAIKAATAFIQELEDANDRDKFQVRS